MNTQPARWKRQNDAVEDRYASILALFDWTKIEESVKARIEQIVREIDEWSYEPAMKYGDEGSLVPQNVVIHVYAECGVLAPDWRRYLPDWLKRAVYRKYDALALRLLSDGVDPFEREPGSWSAATHIRRNREEMPMTWAWLCRHELEKKAQSKRRKRAWASGALVEPRAL